MRYAIYFVPHKLNREKFALKRRQLCKEFKNRKAVMYPIHMTLVKDVAFDDYKEFMTALELFCSDQRPIRLRCRHNMINGGSWGGVEIEKNTRLARFQEELMELCRQHGVVEEFEFKPHISLVYKKDIPSLHSRTSPVKKLDFDRISLVLQVRPGQPYRVAKHVLLRSQ